MKLRIVWWIPVAAVFIAHASGILGNVGTAIIGVDNTITAVIDLKKMVAKIIPPRKPNFVPIKKVIIPPHAKLKSKNTAQAMFVKTPVKP